MIFNLPKDPVLVFHPVKVLKKVSLGLFLAFSFLAYMNLLSTAYNWKQTHQVNLKVVEVKSYVSPIVEAEGK